jgi:hypothetical protein
MIVSNGNISAANNVYAKYSNSQTQSLANDCQVAGSGGAPNCAISSPQVQAGTASTPINF